MEHLKQLAEKLGITVEELQDRIQKNQNAENIVEDTSEDNETSFSQEALNSTELMDEPLNDLKEFGVDKDEPDLFNSSNQSSTSEDFSVNSENDSEEDDLEIPAFLRRQKN